MSKQDANLSMDMELWTIPRPGGYPCPKIERIHGTKRPPKGGIDWPAIARERRVRYLELFYSLSTKLQCKDNCKPSPFEGGDLMPLDRAMRLIDAIQKRHGKAG